MQSKIQENICIAIHENINKEKIITKDVKIQITNIDPSVLLKQI